MVRDFAVHTLLSAQFVGFWQCASATIARSDEADSDDPRSVYANLPFLAIATAIGGC